MDRKKVSSIVTGILLIVAGILALGQFSGLWSLTHLLNGWWTLFLIVPAVSGMIVSGPRPGNICLLLLGVWLFASCQGWLDEHAWTLLLGIGLVLIGVGAMTGWGRKDGHHHHHRHHDSDTPESDS